MWAKLLYNLVVFVTLGLDLAIVWITFEYHRHLQSPGMCGTWAAVLSTELWIVGVISAVMLPAGRRLDRIMVHRIGGTVRFIARAARCVLVGLLAGWFAGIPAARLLAKV